MSKDAKTVLDPVKEAVKEATVGEDGSWNELFGFDMTGGGPLLQGGGTEIPVNHLLMTGVVIVLLVAIALHVRRTYTSSADDAVLPDEGLTWRNILEFTFGYMLDQMSQLMPREAAKRYLPLIATVTIFILFSNLLGLVPGFLPPTQNLNTSFGMAVAVFVAYNAIGFRHHGFSYLEEFISPAGVEDLVGEDATGLSRLIGVVSWVLLSGLFVVIETVSHSFRPISLAVRLTGNMGGDHKVLAEFGELVPLAVPIPFLFLGLLVALVQTLVFALLSVAYISLAVEGSH